MLRKYWPEGGREGGSACLSGLTGAFRGAGRVGCVLGGVQAPESTSQVSPAGDLARVPELPQAQFLYLEKRHNITSLQDWLQSCKDKMFEMN